MSNQIMVVEDDNAIRRLLTFLLQNEGFEVTSHPDAAQARSALKGPKPNLIILDLMLPDQDGVSFAQELRQSQGFERVPVMALTARTQTIDKYEAFQAGFDSYLTKPFDPLELIFNIRALLRLASPIEETVPAELGTADCRLTPAKYHLMVEGREVLLTRLETALLAYLMRHPGQVFSAELLAERILSKGEDGEGRTVDAIHAHIRNLRSKVEADPKNPAWVKTLGRRGYYFPD
jgi:DNA-binding response OmpR family regulator